MDNENVSHMADRIADTVNMYFYVTVSEDVLKRTCHQVYNDWCGAPITLGELAFFAGSRLQLPMKQFLINMLGD